MSKQIYSALNLIDKVTAPLKNINKNVTVTSRQFKKANNELKRFGKDSVSNINSATNRVLKFGAAIGSVAAGFGAKTALSEAMDLEGYKMQLETATKSTKKASEIMKYSVDLANKTPYEAGELVEASSKLESMSLSAKKYLPLVGNMAAATNKSVDQATEALIDAQGGELERLKEFGIKKQQIQEQADKMFEKGTTINAKGQIANQEQFNKTLEKIMTDRFAGGMDKQSKTFKGKMSTVTGIFKSGLATVLGMQDDGTVAKGSAFELLSEEAGKLGSKFEVLQKSGQFIKWQKQLAVGIKSAMGYIKNFMTMVKSNAGLIKQGAGFAIVIAVIAKLVVITLKVIETWTKLSKIFGAIKVVLAATTVPWLGIVAAIAVVIATVAILYAKFKPFRELVGQLGQEFVKVGISVKNTFMDSFSKLKPLVDKMLLSMEPIVLFLSKILKPILSATIKSLSTDITNFIKIATGIVSAVMRILTGIVDFVVGVFTGDWQKAWSGVKDIFGGIVDGIKALFSGLIDSIKSKVKFVTDVVSGVKNIFSGGTGNSGPDDKKPKKNKPAFSRYDHNALGTSYFKGGLTEAHEGGKGEIFDLPSGTRIYPHDKSVKMALSEGKGDTYNVVIQNVIGEDELAKRTAKIIVKEVKKAKRNR